MWVDCFGLNEFLSVILLLYSSWILVLVVGIFVRALIYGFCEFLRGGFETMNDIRAFNKI